MNYDITQLNTLMQARRSTFPKQYDAGKHVERRHRQTNAGKRQLGTHAQLTEPWRFTVFTGLGLKTFAGLQASVYKNSAGDNFRKIITKNCSQHRCLHPISYPLA